jgi:hypothetical protein
MIWPELRSETVLMESGALHHDIFDETNKKIRTIDLKI